MRYAIVLLTLLLASCDYSLIGPGDPAYEQECVIWVAEDTQIDVPRATWEHCTSIRINVVHFDGG